MFSSEGRKEGRDKEWREEGVRKYRGSKEVGSKGGRDEDIEGGRPKLRKRMG